MQKQQFKELIAQALGTLWSHKFRSFLTVLGVVIGTTTTIAVASLVSGMEKSFKDQIEQFGTNVAFVSRFGGGPRFSDLTEEERKRKHITYDDAVAVSQLPLVEAASPMFRPDGLPPVIKYQTTEVRTPQVRGCWASYARTRDVAVARGRFFSETEDEHSMEVCVIGFDIAEKLFSGYDPIGKEISIGPKVFRIVGTLEQSKKSFLGGPNQDSVVFMPYSVLHSMYPAQQEHFIVASAAPGNLDRMIDQITELLRRRRNVPADKPDNFVINTPTGIIDSFGSIMGVIAMVIVPITGVALLIGGIGVMNIMLVSVTERTKEIGVRRAIGARRADIIWQFLLEAMTLTGLGGVIGVGLGFLVSFVINVLLMPSTIPFLWVGIGFGVSVGIGLIFGIYPAFKASRLDPIEALRYE